MLQNIIKLNKEVAFVDQNNLDKHYDISDETYYNRPFSFTETTKRMRKPIPLWQTKKHYKGIPVYNNRSNKYNTVMKPQKPQAGEILCEDYLIYHLKENRDREYREEVCKIFKLEPSDPKMFEKMIEKQNTIYKILHDSGRDDFKKLINYVMNDTKYGFLINGKKESAFSLLFNYDTFWMIHRVIKEFINGTDKVGDNISRIFNFYAST